MSFTLIVSFISGYLYLSILISFNFRQFFGQARTIQEMARKKFDRVRSDFERSEKEKQIHTEEGIKFNHNRMNPVKRYICPSSQEPVGSDFLSGAAQSTPAESQNHLNLSRVSSFGKPFSNDCLVEGNVLATDNDVDRVDEFVSGKLQINGIHQFYYTLISKLNTFSFIEAHTT